MPSGFHLPRKRCRCNGMTGLEAGLLGASCAQREYQRSAPCLPPAVRATQVSAANGAQTRSRDLQGSVWRAPLGGDAILPADRRPLDRTRPILPMLPGTPERATHDYKRHGTSSLYAALDLATGQVIGRLHSKHRAIEFKKFLQTIDREVPANLDVHLVLDNASTHKTPMIKRWLQAHPRFKLHFTPTSSSWLNLVERWFSELTTKKLKRSAHTSVPALNNDIRAWIATWNENPQPFVWTKTADQILDSITRYCERINLTAH
jgi:transposase